jgi:hypothetical protein
LSPFLKLLPSVWIGFPPLVEGQTASEAKQRGVPILSATDASIPRFGPSDTSFCLIVASREAGEIVALDQMGSQIVQHLEELLEALAFRRIQHACGQLVS